MIDRKPPRPEDAQRAQALHAPADWHWLRVDGHCFNCGQQDLWQASYDGDDYYYQCSATCHNCGFEMCCIGKVEADGDPR